MKAGDVATYRHSAPMGHVMAGCPVMLRDVAGDVATIEIATVRLSVPLADLEAARLWWRKGRGAWQGPYAAWPDARDALAGAGVDPAPLEAGARTALGASILSGGWRYRLAWGGDRPPERYGG